MNSAAKDYAPFFRNGRLYLPAHTVTLLTDAGLDKRIGEAALNGLALDDHRDQIALINRTLEAALGQMEEDSQEFRTLTSADTKFLLTGKTASV